MSETGSFSALLRQHRLAASLSQEVLGERAQLSVTAIAALERGRRTAPRPGTVVLLADALRLTPAERATLIGAAAAARLGGPTKPGGVPPPPVIVSNLPVPLTNFIGREHELADIKRLRRETRLLTLTGSGGVGKTRLALRLAEDGLHAYPDGVFFVELAPLSDGALVAPTVLAALGARELPGRRATDTLVELLRTKGVLLVLDNCEHLVDGCAEVSEVVLQNCPGVRVLATSREPLGIAGENIWRVPPLSIPSVGVLPSVENLTQAEAVRLFVERARAAQSSFVLSEATAPAIAQVCQVLDGIPLALELAAPWVGIISVQQIAERLGDTLRLLSTGNRTAPARHQTLRAMVDWSYALLSGEEQQLFRQLSVFAGGCTLEAIEATWSGGDVLPLLRGLVDKSLVTVDEQPYGTRYQMLETLRQYSVEKLRECGEEWPMRTRHLTWCLDLAEQGDQGLWDAKQTEWLRRLQHEQENFRAALGWSIMEPEQLQAGLRLATSLPRLWWWNGYIREGTDWLSKLLETAPYGAERTKALSAAAFLWLRQDNATVAKPIVHEELTLARQLGDRSLLATALLDVGQVRRLEGDAAGAETALEEGLALARALKGPPPAYYFLLHLGLATEALGEPDRALAWFEEGIQQARLAQDQNFVARLLRFRGNLLLERSDLPLAREHLEESLRLSRDTGMVPVSYVVALLAGLAVKEGELLRALRLAGAVLGLRQAAYLQTGGLELATMERRLQPAREALDLPNVERAMAEGAAMSLDEVMQYALRRSSDMPIAGLPGAALRPDVSCADQSVLKGWA